MQMIIDLFGEQVLKPLGEHFLELNSQYVTEEQTFSVTGKRGVRELMAISPEQTTANFIVTVKPDPIQNQTPASRQASLQNSITVLQGIQTQSQGSIQLDLVPAIEALIDSTPEMENVGDIVTTIDEKAKRDILMLERGQMPEIKIRDQHEDLIVASNAHYTENEANYPEEVREVFEKYVTKHMGYIQSQQEINAMKQPVMPQGMDSSGMGSAMGFDPAQAETQGLDENNQTYNLGNIIGAGG